MTQTRLPALTAPHPMQWLIDESEYLRAEIRADSFYQELARGDLDGFHWVYQLEHQAAGFIRALFARAATAALPAFYTFVAHAVEEGRHPEQLRRWRQAVGLDLMDIPPTVSTAVCVDYCMKVAELGLEDIQIIVLNLLSEGVSLDFFQAVIERVTAVGYPMHSYWRTHREVD